MGVLNGKIAVVTGGNSGIGLASALALKDAGAKVAIFGRNQATLDSAKEKLGGEALAFKGDVSNLQDLDKFYQEVKAKYGKVDILFANAGIAKVLPFTEVGEAHFNEHFDINVKGLFFTVQKALPLLSDGASIILNASIVKDKGFAGFSVYTATKAAVRSFARTLTSELKGRKIRVNSLSPGPIETPIYDRMDLSQEAKEGFSASVASQVPLGGFGESEDIAGGVVYLASDASRFVTGIDLVIDGGLSQV